MSKIQRVYSPVTAFSEPHLIFIHGLGGHITSTWQRDARQALWPQWVGEDTGCPVWAVGYDSAISRWKSDAMPLESQSLAILDLLSCETDLRGKPLVLIGHSLGGLVIKSMLRNLDLDVDRHRAVVEKVKGVVFIGTPHFGSRLANILAGIPFVRANPQMHDLKVDEAHLQTLNRHFLAVQRRQGFKSRLFYETTRTPLPRPFAWLPFGVKVVSPSSSEAYIPEEVAIPIEASHLDICKPRDRDAHIHKALITFVQELQADANSDGTPPPPKAGPVRMPSEAFAATEPGDLEHKPVHLAISSNGVELPRSSALTICVAVFVTTDQPKRLMQELANLRELVRKDALIPADAKRDISSMSLRELCVHASTRTRVARELRTIYFSAYLYYCSREQYERLSSDERADKFLLNPLVHRLSKGGELVAEVHTKISDLPVYLEAAARTIREKFDRAISIPAMGTPKYNVLGELADVIAEASAQHLSGLQDFQATELFESLRTRIRFAENVATGEKHLRDKNPLR